MNVRFGPAPWILGFFIAYFLVLQLWWMEGVIPEVFEEQEFAIARDDSWSPFDFAGREGKVTAFIDELLMSIAAEEKIVIRIQDRSAGVLFTGLINASFDGILSPILPTAELLNKFAISNNVYAFGPVVVTRPRSSIHSAEQLQGKIVGITQAVEFLMQYPTDSQTVYVSYSHASAAFEALVKGHVEAVLVGLFNADKYIYSIYKGEVEIVTPPLTDLGIRLFVLKNAKGHRLLDHFNAGLKKIRESGRYEELVKKWQLIYIRPASSAKEAMTSSHTDDQT